MVKLQVNTKEIYLSNLILVISRQHRVSDSEPGDGGGARRDSLTRQITWKCTT